MTNSRYAESIHCAHSADDVIWYDMTRAGVRSVVFLTFSFDRAIGFYVLQVDQWLHHWRWSWWGWWPIFMRCLTVAVSMCSRCSAHAPSYIFEGVHALGHYCHVFLGLVLAGEQWAHIFVIRNHNPTSNHHVVISIIVIDIWLVFVIRNHNPTINHNFYDHNYRARYYSLSWPQLWW